MAGKKRKKKSVLGMDVMSEDSGVVWSWILDKIQYSWCKAGWCMRHPPGGSPTRILHSVLLEGAVGYTIGLHDGMFRAQRGNGAKDM